MSEGLLFTAPKVTKVMVPIENNPLSLQKRNLLNILNKIPDKLSDRGKDKLLLRLSQQTHNDSANLPRTVDLKSIKSALEGFSFNETILPEVCSNEKISLRGRDMKLHFALRDKHGVEKFANKVRQKVTRALSNSREQQAARMTRIRKFNEFTHRLNDTNRNKIWGNSLVEQSFVHNDEALNWLQDPTLDGSRSKSRDSAILGRTRSLASKDQVWHVELIDNKPQRTDRTEDATNNRLSGRQESGRPSVGGQHLISGRGEVPEAVLITESDQVENYERRANVVNEQNYQMRLTQFIKKVDLAKQKASRAIESALENLSSEPEWLQQVNNE